MREWKTVSLGSISSQRKGISYKSEDYSNSEDGHPFITIKCFVKGGGYEPRGIKFYNGVSTKADHLAPGDLLFAVTDLTRAGDIVGSPLRVPEIAGAKLALASMDCMRIEPDVSQCDKGFMYHRLMLADVRGKMVAYSAGSTVLHLDTKRVPGFLVRIPEDTRVQAKIASVLDGIDTTIEKTEALIAKHQQIKAGLMHDLFTRGVLPNGQLRPPRSEAPELYREAAMGWIPRDWAVATMQELLAPLPNNLRSGPFGSALLKHELVEEGIPFLGIDNIHTERFEPTFRRFVSKRKFRELAKYGVRPRDVVITIMGTVGRCCVIPADLDVSLSSKHLWTMTFDTEKVIPELVCWQLNFAPWALAWFRRAMQGGVMDAIQSSTLKTLKLPVPGLEEQELIYARYLKMTERIQRDDEQLQKLQKQKLGLMQDLLTGRVQVSTTTD